MQSESLEPTDPARTDETRHRRSFDHRRTAVREARHWAAETLRADGVPADLTEDALLVACELVANAIFHANTGPIAVTLTTAPHASGPTEVDVEVSDAGGGVVAQRSGDATPSGLGLRVVDALTAGWDVRCHDGGKTVHARVRSLDTG